MREITTGNIIADWKPEYADMFGKETLKLKHTLHQSELFSDARLASLIEKADRTHYHVNTRASGPDGKKRQSRGLDVYEIGGGLITLKDAYWKMVP